MINKIGLDFGTTYSFISYLDNETIDSKGKIISGEEKTYFPKEQYNIPDYFASIVVKKANGKLRFAQTARNVAGEANTTSYTGFKMMLAEEVKKNKKKLEERHYDDDFSPSYVTKEYLNYILSGYIKDMNIGEDKGIEKIVVGVPAAWITQKETIDAKDKLSEIISSLPYIKKNAVHLVSEPAAACAYFAHKYKEKNNRNYSGKLLLIDYGGGTLDIALCDVKEKGEHSEVCVLKECGSGLNPEDEKYIGHAGMAYIEAVVKLALPDNIDDRNPDFQKCMREVEDQLIQKNEDILDFVNDNEGVDTTNSSELFTEITYLKSPYEVTYGMLSKAYKDVIEDVLDGLLTEMLKYISKNEDYKFATVGGFCNFPLTQQQIKNKLKESSTVKKHILDDNTGDCQRAIAYGTALIANEVINYKQVVPYHIGITGTDKDGESPAKDRIAFILEKGAEIEYDTPVFADGEGYGQNIPFIVLSLTDDPNQAPQFCKPERFADELHLGEVQDANYYKIGFSLDRFLRITLHIQVLDPNTKSIIEAREKELANIYEIFGGYNTVK